MHVQFTEWCVPGAEEAAKAAILSRFAPWDHTPVRFSQTSYEAPGNLGKAILLLGVADIARKPRMRVAA